MRIQLETNYDPSDVMIASNDGITIEHPALGFFRFNVREDTTTFKVTLFDADAGILLYESVVEK